MSVLAVATSVVDVRNPSPDFLLTFLRTPNATLFTLNHKIPFNSKNNESNNNEDGLMIQGLPVLLPQHQLLPMQHSISQNSMNNIPART